MNLREQKAELKHALDMFDDCIQMAKDHEDVVNEAQEKINDLSDFLSDSSLGEGEWKMDLEREILSTVYDSCNIEELVSFLQNFYEELQEYYEEKSEAQQEKFEDRYYDMDDVIESLESLQEESESIDDIIDTLKEKKEYVANMRK